MPHRHVEVQGQPLEDTSLVPLWVSEMEPIGQLEQYVRALSLQRALSPALFPSFEDLKPQLLRASLTQG